MSERSRQLARRYRLRPVKPSADRLGLLALSYVAIAAALLYLLR